MFKTIKEAVDATAKAFDGLPQVPKVESKPTDLYDYIYDTYAGLSDTRKIILALSHIHALLKKQA